MPWKVVAVRVTGQDHEATDAGCQDAVFFRTVDNALVAVVSDGAGSARLAARGSEQCSRILVEQLAERLREGQDLIAMPLTAFRGLVEDAVETLRARLSDEVAEAAAAGQPATLSDYHATLLGIVAGEGGAWFFHIGDGAGAAAATTNWAGAVTSPPDNGEYSNQTYFVTLDRWRSHLRLTRAPGCGILALMSDGVSPFAMARGYGDVASGFMRPVTAYLLDADLETAHRTLANTLDTPAARAMNGDDKTLLWAAWVAHA